MSTSRQFQKKASTQSAPTSLSTSMFDRPFPKRSATTEEPSTDTPDFQTRLEFARRHAPDLSRLAANSSRDRPSTIQPKLTIGQPNDQYEQEADRVADQVMSMPESAQPVQREAMPEEEDKLQPKSLAASVTPLVQREGMPEDDQEVHAKAIAPIQREAKLGEEEIQPKSLDPIVQREEVPDDEEQSLHMKAIASSDIQREAMSEDEDEMQRKPLSHNTLQRSSDGSLEAGGSIEGRLNSSKGGGEPLSDEVRSFMEPRFGADFSQVRVHTGGEAVQMNRDLNAQAFTHKQDVYFGVGKAPAKDELTAHELAHVVQQSVNIRTKENIGELIQRDESEEQNVVGPKDITIYSGDDVDKAATDGTSRNLSPQKLAILARNLSSQKLAILIEQMGGPSYDASKLSSKKMMAKYMEFLGPKAKEINPAAVKPTRPEEIIKGRIIRYLDETGGVPRAKTKYVQGTKEWLDRLEKEEQEKIRQKVSEGLTKGLTGLGGRIAPPGQNFRDPQDTSGSSPPYYIKPPE